MNIQSRFVLFFRSNIIGVLLFTILVQICSAQEKVEHEPLFPVVLEQRFIESEETFKEIKDLILENYYSDKINEEALYWAAIQGMLRHISPPDNPGLSKIWTPEQYDTVFNSLMGVKVSIGIKSSFNSNEGSLTVAEVLPGSPAESILEPFDRILRIDSHKLQGKSADEVNNLLKGKEGSEVTLTVNRDLKIFDIKLKRLELETNPLIVTRLTDDILLVEIKKFTVNISNKLRIELDEPENTGCTGLIVDLRNNTGGVFAESLRVTELFLKKQSILLKTLQRDDLQNYVSSNIKPSNFQIAILVNSKTASSSEILASSLQDHQKAIIIGTRTFGKGVFEKTFTVRNNYRVKFITGAMYSPKGISWQGKGITPDFLVKQDENILKTLLKMEPEQRLHKDVSMITAFKLLTQWRQDQ